ncbi:hypothetical protein MKX08_006307 [Trichoderma sp. CBMAI-0020]|nr:hypothetical protein MKX08_006307 [Trichoderma sp. CBMAI-0020]
MPLTHNLRAIRAPVFPLVAEQQNSSQPSAMPAGIIMSPAPDAQPVPSKAKRFGSFLADAAVIAALLATPSIIMNNIFNSAPTKPATSHGSIKPFSPR